MSANTTTSLNTTTSVSDPAFQLKGGLFPLTSLQLLNASLELLGAQLDQKLQQAPKFFFNAPVVIDLQKVNRQESAIDFSQLKNILLTRHLIPVGVRNGNSTQHSEASKSGFAILQESVKEQTQRPSSENKPMLPEETEETESKAAEPNVLGSNTRIVTEPVRSGQQIYARGGDLIVLAPVGHGAELLADGNIHVYAPLRGRALAGVTGDVRARIFCQCLEAELISIAGQYKISEDMASSDWRSAVNIYLEDGRLQVRPL